MKRFFLRLFERIKIETDSQMVLDPKLYRRNRQSKPTTFELSKIIHQILNQDWMKTRAKTWIISLT